MGELLHKVEIKRVYPPTATSTAILLGNDQKTFIIFIGLHEAEALLRAMKGQTLPRPMTHDLLHSILLGFDVTIRKIIISDIVDNAYCATLILEQRVHESDGSWGGRRNEVRIDARPSDCMVLAVKNEAEIYVTDHVLQQVLDVSSQLEQSAEGAGSEGFGGSLFGFRDESEEEDEDEDYPVGLEEDDDEEDEEREDDLDEDEVEEGDVEEGDDDLDDEDDDDDDGGERRS